MIVVLDASAAIELLLQRPAAEQLHQALEDADYILVPDLYVAEVCNALWKYTRAADDDKSAVTSVEDAMALPDEFVSSRELYREAFSFAVQSGHPVYDCLYAILARRNNAQLLTVDRRLAALAVTGGISVLPTRS